MIELALHSATGDSADHTAAGNLTRAVFVGFDSAWADKATAPGAICSVHFDGVGFMDFRPPELVDFDRSLDYIRSRHRAQRERDVRPAEKVVGSLISWMGGGVQPANTGRPLFGRAAPVTLFLRQLGAAEDPEMARTADSGDSLDRSLPSPGVGLLGAGVFWIEERAAVQSGPAQDVSDGGLACWRRDGDA